MSRAPNPPQDATEDQRAWTRWRAAVESSGLGVWDWNALTNEVYFSPEWKSMLGYAEADVGNTLEDWSSRVHPDDMERCYADLQAHFDGQTAMYVNEHRMRCKDGSYRWILDRGQVVARLPDGQPARVVGTHSDITERRASLDALAHSEDRLRTLFNSTFQFIGMLHPDGRVQQVNQAVLDFIDVRLETLVGKFFWQLPDFAGQPDRVSRVREAVHKAASGQAVRMELEIDGAKGRRMTVDFSIRPVFDERGQVTMLIPEGHDITDRLVAQRDLRQSEERFRTTFSEAPIGMALVGLDGRWLEVNDALCEIVGYSRERLMAMTFQDITHPDDLVSDLKLLRQVIDGDLPGYRLNKRYFHRDGNLVHVQLDVSLIHNDDGSPRYFISQIQDVSERVRLDAELFQEKERFEVALASISDAVFITDVSGRLEFVNSAVEELFDQPARQLVGRPIQDVVILRDEVGLHQLPLLACLPVQHASLLSGCARLQVAADADPVIVEYDLAGLKDAAGELMGFTLTLQDITQSRALTMALEHQAHHDMLTGLMNRAGFEKALARQCRDAVGAWCLLYLDLDRFKVVNDTAGHAVGDELLQALAVRMRSVLRAGDVLARLGGDEFGVILDECALPDAEALAAKLVDAVEHFRFRRGDAQFHVGLSLGVADGSRCPDAEELMRRADTACYVAKRTGRGRACTYDEGGINGVRATAEFDTLHMLVDALDHDRLCVHAQKIVQLTSGETVGIELLARIETPDGRCLMPDQFLPVAERHDLMARLDAWVFGRAVALVAGPLPQSWFVCVNASASSIADARFVAKVREIMAAQPSLRDRVCLEISEMTAQADWEQIRQGVGDLREHGVQLIVNDFVAGRSAFACLRQQAVDGIKIARNFTQDLHKDPINEPVISLIGEFARRFDIRAIAEGVEDVAAGEVLLSRGITMAQGYAFHAPEPVERLLSAAKRQQQSPFSG